LLAPPPPPTRKKIEVLDFCGFARLRLGFAYQKIYIIFCKITTLKGVEVEQPFGLRLPTNLTTTYDSIKAAARALVIRDTAIHNYFKINQKNHIKKDMFLQLQK
jgi:hypothetical protein